LLVGGSTGTVLAAVQQLAPEFARGDTIVAISPDLGEKYLDTVYDSAWVENGIAAEGETLQACTAAARSAIAVMSKPSAVCITARPISTPRLKNSNRSNRRQTINHERYVGR
jgi:hypothetical protein